MIKISYLVEIGGCLGLQNIEAVPDWQTSGNIAILVWMQYTLTSPQPKTLQGLG
jgi:hypothetical protein